MIFHRLKDKGEGLDMWVLEGVGNRIPAAGRMSLRTEERFGAEVIFPSAFLLSELGTC